MPKEKILIFLSFLATFIFLFSFIAYAWQEPTTNPPGGNVYAPVNTGPIGQKKEGQLGVNTGSGGFDPTYGLTVGYMGSTLNGIKVTGDSYFEGNITATGQICDVNGCIGDITTYWTLSADNTKLYPNKTGWNVGIGTTNPEEILEIRNDIEDVALRIHDGGVAEYKIGINEGEDILRIVNANGAVDIGTTEKGIIIDPVGNVGIGTTDPQGYKLYVNGNVAVSTGHGYFYASDRSFKTNIQPLENSLDKILKLQGVSFNWKSTGEPSIGLIAQDVEKIFPEVVFGKEGEKTIDYGKLVAPLIEALKEQQEEIKELKAEIEKLKLRIK